MLTCDLVSNVSINAKSSSLYNTAFFFLFLKKTKLSVSEFRGHRKGVGRDPPCHALIVIVMLMEGKETGKLAG